jgi:hypothetical protein
VAVLLVFFFAPLLHPQSARKPIPFSGEIAQGSHTETTTLCHVMTTKTGS